LGASRAEVARRCGGTFARHPRARQKILPPRNCRVAHVVSKSVILSGEPSRPEHHHLPFLGTSETSSDTTASRSRAVTFNQREQRLRHA